MANTITKEEFEAWRYNPVTRAVMDILQVKRTAVMERLGTGGTLVQDNADLTLSFTSKAIGQIEALSVLINMPYPFGE